MCVYIYGSTAFPPAFLQHYFALLSCFSLFSRGESSRSGSIQIMMIYYICIARKHVFMYPRTFWHACIQICEHVLNHFCVRSVCMQMYMCMLCLALECVGHVCVCERAKVHMHLHGLCACILVHVLQVTHICICAPLQGCFGHSAVLF